jgi:chromatin remodeling complex protein RSC6
MSIRNPAGKSKPATTTARKPAAKKTASSKPAAKSVPAKATPAKPEKKNKKARKTEGKSGDKKKVVRDSFTMPQGDYALLASLKQSCLKTGLHVKKSELLRAGLHALSKLSVAQLKLAVGKLEQIKTGRPKKG